MGLFEEVSDCVGHNVGLLGIRHRMGAVRDCNDDDKGNRIGEGELRVLGAFRDSSESAGSRNGNGGFGHLFHVQFDFDFYIRASKKGQKSTTI
jgi:hypothetical protein